MKQLTNEQRFDKMVEELREKIAEGWQIEVVQANRSFNDNEKRVLWIEVELVEP